MVITRETKNAIHVKSTFFEDVPYFMGGSKRMMNKGGRYYAFQSDNTFLKDFSSAEAAYDHANKMALANYVMGMTLWRKGIAECNDWVNHYRGTCKNVIIDSPGEIYEEDAE